MERPAPRLRVGATSFVYPADWVSNVRRLAGRVDDIELLFFRARQPGDLPDPSQVEQLRLLRRQGGLTYSIHLPIDLQLAGPESDLRQAAVDEVRRAIDAVRTLAPTCWVLHVEGRWDEGHGETPEALERWQERASGSLRQLLAGGIEPGQLAIESLDYDFGRIRPVIDALGLSAALDLGHELRQGRSVEQLVMAHLDRAPVIHLHGVDERGQDHRAISAFPEETGRWLLDTLAARRWPGALTLEVFDLMRLELSLDTLARWSREEDRRDG